MASYVGCALWAICCCWVPLSQAQAWSTGLIVAQGNQSQTLAQQVQEAEKMLLQGRLQAAFNLLDEQKQRLQQHSKGWYMYGVLALRIGRYELAHQTLSRLVDQYPNHAGARLDLALAAVQLGYYPQAQQLLDELLTYTHIPPGVAVLITSYQRQIDAATRLQRRPSGRLTLESGFNSNINWGLPGEQVTLNTLNGPLVMNLGEANQARGDRYQQLALVLDNAWQTAATQHAIWPRYQLQLSGQQRTYETLPSDNTQQWQAAFSHRLGDANSNTRLSWQWDYDVQDDNRQRTLGLQSTSRWQWPAAQTNIVALTLGVNRLQYASDVQHEYQQYRLQVDQEFFWHQKAWLLYAGANQQQALNTLESGAIPAYDGRVVGVRVDVRNDASVNASVGMEWRMDQDRQAYNSQIFGNKAKRTEQLRLQASVAYNMGNNWQLIGKANWLQQHSNIALFTIRQWDASVAAQVKF